MSLKLTVALDWTPNTNHIGFFVAKANGWYKDAGLDVSLISPHVDEYKTTPGQRVADKTATFAVTPSETVVSYHTHLQAADKPKVRAVAALLQGSTSAIVTLKSSGIERPAQLDGKTYASYGARFEGRIVQQMIRNNGGKGDYVESTPPMLGIWNTLLKGEADATWVFMGWEGVEARRKGVELNAFSLEDYQVPYGYSPLLVVHPDTLSEKAHEVAAFLEATARGYQLAVSSPAEAAKLMMAAVAEEYASSAGGGSEAPPLPQPLEEAMLVESLEYLAPHLLTKEGEQDTGAAGRWGAMSEARWSAFLDWLSDTGLLTTKVQSRKPDGDSTTSLDGLRAGDVGQPIPRGSLQASALFTNDYLP